MVKRLMSVALVALVGIVALAACGSEDEESAQATVTRIPNPLNAPVIGSPTAEEEGGGGANAATEVDLNLVDVAFEPKDFTIAANTDVVIHLHNVGAAPHNFTVDSLGISQDVAPGESKDVTINTGPGQLDYYCAVPGHRQAGMEGTITVVAGGGEAPAVPGGASPSPAGSPSPGASPAPLASPGGGAETPSGPITIDLQDVKFVPSEFSVPANTPTKVTLTNTGAAPHNFSIDELSIDEDLNPGESKEIEINADAGEYKFYCNVPGHEAAGMVGTLTVQ